MENQHKKITGYRDLSQDEIDLINKAKALAEQCGEFIEEINAIGHRAKIHLDHRWLAVGTTHLQQGFMAVIRSIAKPTTF